MEVQINRLETRIENMQEKFNKHLEDIKKSQSIMNNAITEIKSTLDRANSRITETEIQSYYDGQLLTLEYLKTLLNHLYNSTAVSDASLKFSCFLFSFNPSYLQCFAF